jgi:hypothetical protein
MSRGDINVPNYDSFPLHTQVLDVESEAAMYELLRFESNIRASRLLYYRVPVQNGSSSKHGVPRDISGRRLFLFEKTDGENNIWTSLGAEEKVCFDLEHSYRFRHATMLAACC